MHRNWLNNFIDNFSINFCTNNIDLWTVNVCCPKESNPITTSYTSTCCVGDFIIQPISMADLIKIKSIFSKINFYYKIMMCEYGQKSRLECSWTFLKVNDFSMQIPSSDFYIIRMHFYGTTSAFVQYRNTFYFTFQLLFCINNTYCLFALLHYDPIIHSKCPYVLFSTFFFPFIFRMN